MTEARGERQMVIRLVDGEDLMGHLQSVSETAALVLVGIGMVRDAQLGFWNGSEYEVHEIPEPCELLAMQGNIGMREGERVVHCHLTIGRRDGTVTGGHLIAATVHNTAEIALGLLPDIVLERRIEPNGLAGLYPESRTG